MKKRWDLSRWFRKHCRPTNPVCHKPRPSVRPLLEILEARWLPSTGQTFIVNDTGNPTVYPISESGPYYATILAAGTLDTKGGPRTNTSGQVLGADGVFRILQKGFRVGLAKSPLPNELVACARPSGSSPLKTCDACSSQTGWRGTGWENAQKKVHGAAAQDCSPEQY